MDRLENFINKNREDFDQGVPDLKVWAAIEQNLSAADAPSMLPEKKAKVISFKRVMSIAASVLVLLLAGGIGGTYIAQQQNATAISSLSDIDVEHAEVERYFSQLIEEKTKQLAHFDNAENVKSDLQQLDEVFKELSKELKIAPKGMQEQIINAMIKNYQAKIDILNRVIEKREKAGEARRDENSQENEISI